MPLGIPSHLQNPQKPILVSLRPRLFFSPSRCPVSFRANAVHTDPAPNTTRELLRHLGWLIEEVVRGSQEKVGLAQAAYDSVS